jgi:hypothetical protein
LDAEATALGQKRSSRPENGTSAIRPKPDIAERLNLHCLRPRLNPAAAQQRLAVLTVKRRGETWEAVTMSPNQIAYPDCVTRVTRYAAVLRTEYA